VLTTHYLEEAELLCTRIGMLKAGRLVALDSTRNLLDTFSGLQLKLRLGREALPAGLEPHLISRQAIASPSGSTIMPNSSRCSSGCARRVRRSWSSTCSPRSRGSIRAHHERHA